MTTETGTAPGKKSQQHIHWAHSLKLANNKPEFAEELLAMLVEDLPNSREHILNAFEAQDISELHHHVHRLNGASSYCGVPRLKATAASLETEIKRESADTIPSLVKKLLFEIDCVIETYNMGSFRDETTH